MLKTILVTAFISVTAFTAVSLGESVEGTSQVAPSLSLVQEKGGPITSETLEPDYHRGYYGRYGRYGRYGHHGYYGRYGRYGHHGRYGHYGRHHGFFGHHGRFGHQDSFDNHD
ncbi:MAG TPA: hypothetical protein VIG33_15180 [Pseudobdellovibrionaceae bacterium]|jgi:hypothetical protein